MKVIPALLAALLLAIPSARAQEPSGTTTTLVEVPTRDIIPKPGSGESPDDAGDRGGALQLIVLGLVVIAIAGAVLVVVRQSRQAHPRS